VPFVVEKDVEACSASEPWAVKNKDTGDVKGCHSSESKAKEQQAALYANTNDAAARIAAQAATLERQHLHSFVTAEAMAVELPEPEVTYEEDGIVLCKLENVPLIKAGFDWPSMNGPVTFGDTHLAAAVAASADPILPRARIGLGHTDPRYNPHNCPQCQAEIAPDLDGDPNFGFVENLRLEDADTVLMSDLVDVPLWLAKVLPVAYPSRSIEGWFAFVGPNKKEYSFVLTRLALLGVQFPAVLALNDLPQLYGAETPDFVEVTS
jgi:hypothetical protein